MPDFENEFIIETTNLVSELRDKEAWITLYTLQIAILIGMFLLFAVVSVVAVFRFAVVTVKLPFRVIKSLWNKYAK